MKNAWLERFEELKKFQQKYGCCLVPKVQRPGCDMDAKTHKRLYDFVNNQRSRYWRSIRQPEKFSFDPVRKQMLDEIKFTWRAQVQKHSPHAKKMVHYDETFREMLQKVKAFSETHPQCWIPVGYPEDPALGRWCRQRRYEKKHNILRSDRVEALDQVGFLWEYPKKEATNNKSSNSHRQSSVQLSTKEDSKH